MPGLVALLRECGRLTVEYRNKTEAIPKDTVEFLNAVSYKTRQITSLFDEKDNPFPKVITLCGSTKFKEVYEKVTGVLSLQGHIVISVGLFGHRMVNGQLTPEQKEKLDVLHLRKIDLCDEVWVIDVPELTKEVCKAPYIGQSTSNEVRYCTANEVPVTYVSKVFLENPEMFA